MLDERERERGRERERERERLLKMGAAGFSETFLSVGQTVPCRIPDDSDTDSYDLFCFYPTPNDQSVTQYRPVKVIL